MLPDGSYEAMVLDVADHDGIVLTLTLVGGEHKGEVVDVRANHLHHDAIDLLAMPCVLTVVDGRPSVVMD